MSAKARQRWKENSNPHQSRVNHLWQRYKIRPEEYDALFLAQNGVCGICESNKPLRIDHCHDTGLIRGLLCNACNVGLGGLGDTIEGLEKAIAYLRKYEASAPIQPVKIKQLHRAGKDHHWYGNKEFQGEKNLSAKLTEEDVRQIRYRYEYEGDNQRELGERFNVSGAMISKIVTYQNWTHVE